jgi:hypothetical protein
MKEVMNFKDFCKEKGLSGLSKESQAKYQIYIKEMEKENRPYLDDIHRQAKEVKENLSKKK